MNRYRRDLQRAFPDAKIEKTNGGHLRLRLPNDRFVIASSTTACQRAIRNTRRLVKREKNRA
jgi:hypothetical protein